MDSLSRLSRVSWSRRLRVVVLLHHSFFFCSVCVDNFLVLEPADTVVCVCACAFIQPFDNHFQSDRCCEGGELHLLLSTSSRAHRLPWQKSPKCGGISGAPTPQCPSVCFCRNEKLFFSSYFGGSTHHFVVSRIFILFSTNIVTFVVVSTGINEQLFFLIISTYTTRD